MAQTTHSRRSVLRSTAVRFFVAGLLGGLVMWSAPHAFADGLVRALRLSPPETLTTPRDPVQFARDLQLVLPKSLVPLTVQDAVAHELMRRTKSMSRRETLRTAQVLCDEARRLGQDPLLLLAVIYVESYFNHTAVSVVGAEGLMQLMPPTASWMAEREEFAWVEGDTFDPELNVRLGSRYLAYLLDYYDGNFKHALTAYNRGTANTDYILKHYHGLPEHVHEFYSGKVLERYRYFRAAYGHLPLS